LRSFGEPAERSSVDGGIGALAVLVSDHPDRESLHRLIQPSRNTEETAIVADLAGLAGRIRVSIFCIANGLPSSIEDFCD
jgi:hypothetical protein